jgi:hypothetical protein
MYGRNDPFLAIREAARSSSRASGEEKCEYSKHTHLPRLLRSLCEGIPHGKQDGKRMWHGPRGDGPRRGQDGAQNSPMLQNGRADPYHTAHVQLLFVQNVIRPHL